MSEGIPAIFENGVFRPVGPVELPEQTAVTVYLVGARQDQGSNPMIGLLADEPALADLITESAMSARESRPLRADRG